MYVPWMYAGVSGQESMSVRRPSPTCSGLRGRLRRGLLRVAISSRYVVASSSSRRARAMLRRTCSEGFLSRPCSKRL